MANSSRHHYIPRFLIKHFSDENGLIYVYNKQKDEIVSSKQSTKAIFFEWDRNIVKFRDGTEKDNIEQLYASLDTKFALDLKNILNLKKCTPEELMSLVVLACTLKWRVPSSDTKFNSIKETTTLEELSVNIQPIDLEGDAETNKKAMEEILNSDILKESKRFLLPLLPFIKNPDILLSINENSYIHTNPYTESIIGDCPIIEEESTGIYDIGSFIFPISSTDTFIYKPESNKQVTHSMFYSNKDLAIFHLSEKYVACKDKEYLENVIRIYKKIKEDNKSNEIVTSVFTFV